MLPPLLTHDIIQGLKQFLTTGFEPFNPFFQGLMQRFVADEQAWLKGPFLQLGLPFRTGSQGAGFFPGLTMQHAGYVHQEKSWERLWPWAKSAVRAVSAKVAIDAEGFKFHGAAPQT